MKIVFVIYSHTRDAYWDGGKNFVSMYKLCKEYTAYQEAVDILLTLENGMYEIQKRFIKE